jgi:hypothetical protein
LSFAERNKFGIIDHFIIPERGEAVYVPMRVLANGHGTEVIFTLFKMPFMDDEKYDEDIKWVEKDLGQLKALLEKN